MQKLRWFTLNIVTYQLLNTFKEGLRGSMEKTKAIIYHHPSPITTRLTCAEVRGFEAFVFFFECPHDA
jgi:hypothetical protein